MTDSPAKVEAKTTPAGEGVSAASKLLEDCGAKSKSQTKCETKPEVKVEPKPDEPKKEVATTETKPKETEKPNAALAWLDTMSGGIFNFTGSKQKPSEKTPASKVEQVAAVEPAEQKQSDGGLLGIVKSGVDLVGGAVKTIYDPIKNGFNSLFEDDKNWKASNVCTPMSTAECQWMSDLSKKDFSWTKDLSEFEVKAEDLQRRSGLGRMGQFGKEREHWGADETTQAAQKVANGIYKKDGDYVFKQNGQETKLEDAGNGKYKLKLDQLNFEYDANNLKLEATNGTNRVEVEARTPPPLELPEDAREAGVTTIDRKEYKVFKGEGNETFLVKDGRVISKVNEDGSFTISRQDGHLEVKLGQKADGTYELERLERWSFGRIRSLFERGKSRTTYHYDDNGKRREITEILRPITHEEMARLRTEMLPDSTLLVVTGEGDKRQWFALRHHGRDENGKDKGVSEVELRINPRTGQPDTNGRTRLFKDGDEFRINENGEVLVVGPDGVPRAVEKVLGPEMARRLRQIQNVAARDAGFVLRSDGSGAMEVRVGSADEGANSPDQADDVVTTIAPNGTDVTTKDQLGETSRANIETGTIELLDKNGEQYFHFDTKTGAKVTGTGGEKFAVDSRGLTHEASGLSMDKTGNVRFADGSMFVDSKGVCHSDSPSSASAKSADQYRNAEATGNSEMAKASSLMGPARGVICGAFDPATAESLCIAAYGGLSGAISLAMGAGNLQMAGQLMSKQSEASHLIGLSSAARKATVQRAHELPAGGAGMGYMIADAARNAAMGMSPNEAFLNMLAKVEPTNPKVAHRATSNGNLTLSAA